MPLVTRGSAAFGASALARCVVAQAPVFGRRPAARGRPIRPLPPRSGHSAAHAAWAGCGSEAGAVICNQAHGGSSPSPGTRTRANRQYCWDWRICWLSGRLMGQHPTYRCGGPCAACRCHQARAVNPVAMAWRLPAPATQGLPAARLAIFATVARPQPVASWTCVHDIPRASMEAMLSFLAVFSGRPL
jgi:hypothetical protein